MKKKYKLIILVVVILVILLFPIKQMYKDGGTTTYTSILYKVIKWKDLDGKTEMDFYVFPFNFKSIDNYRKKVDDEELEKLFLTSDKEFYSLDDKIINFTIVNNTNKNLYTHASPTLEVKTDTGWEVLEKNNTAGFCGNKDVINKAINMSLILSWYDNLEEGSYRISFNIYDGYNDGVKDYIVSKEFSLQVIQTNQRENSVSCNKNDFEMSLFSDKYEYKTNEKIKIWGTFKYVGDNNQIKIWHASSYIIFSITNGKDFNVIGVVNDILKSTTIDRDKLYHFDYQKSGGFDANDPDADYWQKFYSEKDLLLPADEYTIIMNGNFSYSANMQEKVDLMCELKIKVS